MSIREEIHLQWRSGGVLKRLLFINIGVFLALHAVGFVCWLTGSPPWDLRALDYLMASGDGAWVLHRPWTLVTYMFTHYDVGHILWNMMVFWFSGQLFQSALGPQRLLGNYVLGGLTGYLFYLFGYLMPPELNMIGNAPILGASAAIMSVLIGVATHRPNMEVGLFLIGAVRMKYLAIGLLIIDLIGVRSGGNTGGHLAHLGGALYGFLAARQLMRGRDWSQGFVRWLERVGAFFRRGRRSHLRVEKRARRRILQDVEYNAAKRDKQARVDAILDKISRSGYDSLSREERDFLFRASHEK